MKTIEDKAVPNSPYEQEKVIQSPEMAEAEADIARTRERVTRSVMALRHEVAKSTDWREWVRRKPGLFLAAAFAVGFVWGRRP
jgi:hypothetical protein